MGCLRSRHLGRSWLVLLGLFHRSLKNEDQVADVDADKINIVRETPIAPENHRH